MKALVAAQARGTAVAADIDGCETRLELAAWGFARPRRHFAKRIADEGAAAKFDTIWPSIPTRLTAATRTPLAIACERWVRAVTLAIIAEVLGIPIEHQPMLKALADRVFSSVHESLMLAGAFLTARPDTSGSNGATWRHDFFPIRAIESSVHDFTTDAVATLRRYFIEEISQRRASPGDDLISVLVSVQDETDTLRLDELLALVLLLLFAGDTTTNLIANGLLALSTHPDQLRRLGLAPEVLRPNAVEEVLRYDSHGPNVNALLHAGHSHWRDVGSGRRSRAGSNRCCES